ncbi:MAG: glycoside hydrolase family protein [Akkermansiaceae bacterium]|jgi:hypothetical protein|nr:glycoside hydrolase family protein [Akkermansiaceae bacterium]
MILNRRHWLTLSLSALGSTATLQGRDSARSGSAKKGLGIAAKRDGWEDALLALRCKWFYNWNLKHPGGEKMTVPHVPMVWKRPWKQEPLIVAAKNARAKGVKELLGFNEPDEDSQADMKVATALDAWPMLEKTGMRLGSPGCVHPDGDWMKQFMAGVEKRGLKVDFVCVHSYGGTDVDAFIKRLGEVQRMFRRPIWITEFAVGDWDAKSVEQNRHRPDQVLRYMETLLPMLDRMDFIERYAWFPSAPDHGPLGTSALFDREGKLTRLGECYRDA